MMGSIMSGISYRNAGRDMRLTMRSSSASPELAAGDLFSLYSSRRARISRPVKQGKHAKIPFWPLPQQSVNRDFMIKNGFLAFHGQKMTKSRVKLGRMRIQRCQRRLTGPRRTCRLQRFFQVCRL
jgi:hypothetical protein